MRFLFYTLLLLNISLLSGNAFCASENITIPPPTPLGNAWLPPVNQFILMPTEGRVLVYYLGVFNTNAEFSQDQKTKTFLLPIPQNAENIQTLNAGVVLNANAMPVAVASTQPLHSAQVTTTEGVQQIQLSFILNAPFGRVNWRPDGLTTLPGVTILMMNDSAAKIMMTSANFIQDFNKSSPSGQQFVRVSWNENTPYPAFTIVNIVPSRVWVYVMVGVIGAFLFLSLFFVYRRTRLLCTSSPEC